MKRREFIKLAGIAGAYSSLFSFPSSHLYAAHDGYTGPLYILIDANGGWDPTSFCDPKGYTPNQTTPRINNYPSSSIEQVGNIKFAPPPDKFIGNTDLYSSKEFFTKHHQKLLVINGIDTGTNSHSDGERVSWSGELSKSGYPNIGALIAGTLAPGRSLSFLAGGGYNFSAGLVVPIRVDYKSIDALIEIAYPNRVTPSSTSSKTYINNDIETLIKTTNIERLSSEINRQRLPSIKNTLNKLLTTRANQNHLSDMANILESTTEKPLSFFNNRTRAQDLYRQGRLALASYDAGVTAAAHLTLKSFDTHSNHDNYHYPILMDLLQGIDGILQEAQERGLSDKIVIIMGSDFGRTNVYNVDNGKDHWPITSMMFIGNSQQIIKGNRVIGATTDDFKAIKLDRDTLAPDFSGSNSNSITLTPGHIHRSLRGLAGIDQTALSLKYNLGGETLNLFS